MDLVYNQAFLLFLLKNEEKIKSYIVSTGKDSIKKPLGVGRISQISLNPVWYPTADTKKSFAKKGIILPNVVPPNHKYNYMGMAKLNLTHSVDGNTTYRIHGTLNEKTELMIHLIIIRQIVYLKNHRSYTLRFN